MERLAVDPWAAHAAVANFLGLDPVLHLPQQLRVANSAQIPAQSFANAAADAGASLRRRAEPQPEAQPEAQAEEEEEVGSVWCVGATEADGPLDAVSGCRWAADAQVLRALDGFYQDSTQRLNALLRDHLDTPNPWWAADGG